MAALEQCDVPDLEAQRKAREHKLDLCRIWVVRFVKTGLGENVDCVADALRGCASDREWDRSAPDKLKGADPDPEIAGD
jgi:hypothetical protein